jgi:serine/threonine protein kinase
MAPEILNQKSYTHAADVWSIGCIFFKLLTGNMPFLGRNYPELIGNLRRGNFTIEKDIFLSSDCALLIQYILRYDVDARITWQDLHEHPYIQSEDYYE